MVQVNIALKDGSSLQVSLLVVPLICEPLVSQPSSYIDAQHNLIWLIFQLEILPWKSTCSLAQIITRNWPVEETVAQLQFRLGILSGPMKSFESTETATNLVTTHVLKADCQESDNRRLNEEL